MCGVIHLCTLSGLYASVSRTTVPILGICRFTGTFLYISIALAAERSCMAEVHVFGRVTNDLQLKMSSGRRGYPQGFPHLGPRLFGAGGLHQKRWKRKGQAAEAQPDGMAVKVTPYRAKTRAKAKPRRCPAAAASCGGRGRRSGTPAGISVFRRSEKEEPHDVF